MKYVANRPLIGDYGSVMPGQIFEVPDSMIRKYQVLEGKGIIRRYREPKQSAPYTVTYQNKAVTPEARKKA